ncbi:MAG TPA: N-succinylarginine dihydrolase [Sandaracinaceae bacterium LLY-WYZ-13_1]|nr:N-succinylarginine dihydrolase [Sandaracinaceae bacterium LLY-WYZ-13_1]
MPTTEANFDGLVGPTHNYAGLSYGNVASTAHAGAVASPREAALQGLAKMKALAELGLVQGVLPPQERPDVRLLRRLGFEGSDAAVIERAAKTDPTLLAIASSASAMWTANAATVAPSADTADGRVHFTPANLLEKAHRAIEPETTRRVLEAVFADRERFVVHPPLPATQAFGDEGAANHTRLAVEVGAPGTHVFVYGRRGLTMEGPRPVRFPARQTLEASRAVARLHRLPEERCLFVQQRPDVVDRGVFHNDVIAVGHERWLLHHEEAFVDGAAALEALRSRVEGLVAIEVPSAEVSVDDAVRSYLFNSQLVRPPGHDAPLLVAPLECREVEPVRRWLEASTGPGRPIAGVRTLDLRQSMRNGGGPACLRLRVVLTDAERAAARCLWDDALQEALEAWVSTHYRDRLSADDLRDPKLLEESRTALDELTRILGIGAVYPFQRPESAPDTPSDP